MEVDFLQRAYCIHEIPKHWRTMKSLLQEVSLILALSMGSPLSSTLLSSLSIRIQDVPSSSGLYNCFILDRHRSTTLTVLTCPGMTDLGICSKCVSKYMIFMPGKEGSTGIDWLLLAAQAALLFHTQACQTGKRRQNFKNLRKCVQRRAHASSVARNSLSEIWKSS